MLKFFSLGDVIFPDTKIHLNLGTGAMTFALIICREYHEEMVYHTGILTVWVNVDCSACSATIRGRSVETCAPHSLSIFSLQL